jgi:hypothetical protein
MPMDIMKVTMKLFVTYKLRVFILSLKIILGKGNLAEIGKISQSIIEYLSNEARFIVLWALKSGEL